MQKTGIGKYILVLLMFVFTVKTTIAQKFSPSSYIAEYKEMAQQLMTETGVPASVILAVAIHESAYGNSRIAKHLNNHFGVKGRNSSKAIRSAYKGYSSVRESYLDFIDLLQRRKSTSSLFDNHSHEDYKSWIRGIARSGYSTTGDWSSKVLATIDRYDLDNFDRVVATGEASALAQTKGAVKEDILLAEMNKNATANKFDVLNVLVVKKGDDTLSALVKKYNSSTEVMKKRSKLASTKLSVGQKLLL